MRLKPELIENAVTDETDTTKALRPDGDCGVAWQVDLPTKAGIVAPGDFASGGSPARQQAVVTFTTAFADNLYAISIGTEATRTFVVTAKSATGFTIRSSSNSIHTGDTFWIAVKSGETG